MTDPTPTPTPHRATPEQWHRVRAWGNLQAQGSTYGLASTICELRARVEALEGQQQAPCPHIRSSDEGTSYCADGERFSDWYVRSGISRSTAYELLKAVCITPDQRRIPGSARPVSFLTNEQVDLMSEAAEQFKNGKSMNWLRLNLGKDQPPAAPDPALSETLVWQIAEKLSENDAVELWADDARAAIREVARWLRANPTDCGGWWLQFGAAAARLEQEADR